MDISTKWDMQREADRFQKSKKASTEGRVLEGEIRRRESMWCRNSRGRRSVNSNSKAPTSPASGALILSALSCPEGRGEKEERGRKRRGT